MALIGTISGSNDTSNTAVTGTLVIANTAGTFPSIQSDAVLFVSGGLDGTSKSVFGGNIVSSGSISVKDPSGTDVVILQTDGDITGSSLLLNDGFVVTGSGIIESNTTIPALRVTQQGTGAAILVEDSSNPDSSPFTVTGTGRVGIGTLAPTSQLFITGTDSTVPVMTVRSADAAVDTLVITSSAAAGGNVGIIQLNQGNLSNKRILNITNIGGGTSGIRMEAAGLGTLSFDNFNVTPQISTGNKNLAFNSNGAAFDSTQVTFRFVEVNKTPTYPNQRTFLISGNQNGHKTGSYFEVEKSGSLGPLKLLELQGDVANNALFISGSTFITGSAFINGNLAVTGGNIDTTATIFNLVNTTATTVNFAGAATNLFKVGNSAGKNEISGSTSFPQGLSGSLTRLTDGTSYIIQGQGILVASASNGAVTITGGGGSSPINVYTTTVGSPFTLAIPAHTTMIEIEACGGGGGGGSGRKNLPANGVYGGGGGAGGAYSSVVLNAATVRAISSNLTISIGAGGLGGSAQTVDSTNGITGSNGGDTTISAGATTLLVAPGGSGGQPGTNTNGLGGVGPSWYLSGGNGGSSSNTLAPAQPALAGFAGAGGAGGGITTAATALNGGNGGHGGDLRVDNVARTGQGGNAATPRDGTNATVSSTYSPTGGGGGGGGAGRNGGGPAGNGGNGIQGSGGGGGGGNTNLAGNDSGKGGDGGTGWCVVRFS